MRYLLILLLFATVVAELYRVPFLSWSGISLVDIIAPLIVFIWLIRSFLLWKKIDIYAWFPALMIFLSFSFLSLLYNISDLQLWLWQSMESFFYLVRYFSLSFLILIVYNFNIKDRIFIFNSTLITSFLLFVWWLFQLKYYWDFFSMNMQDIWWDPHIWRMLSSWFDPNYLWWLFAFIISLASGTAFDLFKNKQKWPYKYLLIWLIVCLLVWIVLTYSRSALLALWISVFIWWLFLSRKLLLISICLFIVTISFVPRMQDRFMSGVESAKALFVEDAKALDPTAKLRIKSWQVWMEIYKENPIIWIWFNTLKFEQKKKWALLTDSHWSSWVDSSIISIMAMTWSVWLVFYLIFLYQILKKSYRVFKKKHCF